MNKSTNPNKLTGDDRETIKTQNALERRRARQNNRGNGVVADWEGCDPAILQKLIGTVTIQKGTITLGYTRDGGAYYISYYFGGESEPVYCRPSEGIDAFLQGEIEAFKA
jgi:hypothetical protein